MQHILEHVAEPMQFMAELSRNQKPGGSLFIDVPNLTDPIRNDFDERKSRLLLSP